MEILKEFGPLVFGYWAQLFALVVAIFTGVKYCIYRSEKRDTRKVTCIFWWAVFPFLFLSFAKRYGLYEGKRTRMFLLSPFMLFIYWVGLAIFLFFAAYIITGAPID